MEQTTLSGGEVDVYTGAVDWLLDVCLELAQARVGGLEALRAFTRAERARPDDLRVL